MRRRNQQHPYMAMQRASARRSARRATRRLAATLRCSACAGGGASRRAAACPSAVTCPSPPPPPPSRGAHRRLRLRSAEFSKIAQATSVGFFIMGFIGFFVKLIFIPINNIIVGMG